MRHHPDTDSSAASGLPARGAPQRGVILREPAQAPGLVSVTGRQLPFTLETHWRSDRPPVAGAKVDVDLDADGALAALRLVDEVQVAKDLAGQAARQVGERGQQVWQQALREFGRVPLAAMALLLVSWFFLDLFSVRAMGVSVLQPTLWEASKLLGGGADALTALRGGGGGSAGLWGLLIVAAAFAPLLPLAWRDRRANYGLAAPLALLAGEGVRGWLALHGAMEAVHQQTQGSELGRDFSRYAEQMADEMQRQALAAISLGAGFYLGVAAAVVLAAFAALRLLARG